MPDELRGGLLYRITELTKTVERLETVVDEDGKAITLLNEQISGERGLNAAITELAAQMSGLRRAAWWLAGIIVTASIGFAFGVLALIPA